MKAFPKIAMILVLSLAFLHVGYAQDDGDKSPPGLVKSIVTKAECSKFSTPAPAITIDAIAEVTTAQDCLELQEGLQIPFQGALALKDVPVLFLHTRSGPDPWCRDKMANHVKYLNVLSSKVSSQSANLFHFS